MKLKIYGIVAALLALAVAIGIVSPASFAEEGIESTATMISEGITETILEETTAGKGEEPTGGGAEERPKEPVSLQSSFSDMLAAFTVMQAECGMKYAYYSPVRDEADTAKYPLVVYVHGRFHGWNEETFKNSGLTYWCTEEMQAMFEAGGAHLLMPKDAPWFGQAEQVYQVICEYMAQNSDTVDADRVFIMGGSAGGSIAWKVLVEHPALFRGGVMLCSVKAPTAKEIEAVADVPIWEISAVIDPFAIYPLTQKPTWKKLTATSHVKEQCRWTVFNKWVTLPDGSRPILPHFLAKTIGYNLCLLNDDSVLPDCTTVDGDGNEVEITLQHSIIQWLDEICTDRGAEEPAEPTIPVEPEEPAEPAANIDEPTTEAEPTADVTRGEELATDAK